jgi:hypothetical protein
MMRKRTIYLLFLNAGNEITEHSPASRQTVRQSSEGVHCRQMNGTWHSKDNGEFTYYKYGYKGDSLNYKSSYYLQINNYECSYVNSYTFL